MLATLPACSKDQQPEPPDCRGTRLLLFTSNRQTSTNFQIYLYDLAESGFRLIANLNSAAADNLNPAITSDARVIAFESTRGATGVDILLYDRCIASLVTQPGLVSAGNETDPAFSHDAFKLAFARDTLGYRRIRLADGPSDKFVALPGLDTTGAFHDWAPSPDLAGTLIAFVSDRNGNPDVFVYDGRGDSLLNLPDLISPEADLDPWITPNGRYLAFASGRSGGEGDLDLYLYDLQNLTFVVLTSGLNTPEVERNPTMSPDADLIVFQSNRSGGRGGMDVWNHTRSTGVTAQSAEESSAGEDLQPWLIWQ